MGEIGSTVAEAIKNRATSTTLITYSCFWLAWHWQGIYTALFVNEDLIFKKFGYLKNEYLNTYFFGWHEWQTVAGLIVPLILTILFIWPFQKYALIHAYKLEQAARKDRKQVRFSVDRQIETYKAELLNEESEKIEAQSKKVEAETKLSQSRKRAVKSDPTILWEEDYRIFKKSQLYGEFATIRDAVYEHNGHTFVSSYDNGGVPFSVRSTMLAYADTDGLIQIDQKAEKITLTDKGKYFVKRYQQDTENISDSIPF